MFQLCYSRVGTMWEAPNGLPRQVDSPSWLDPSELLVGPVTIPPPDSPWIGLGGAAPSEPPLPSSEPHTEALMRRLGQLRTPADIVNAASDIALSRKCTVDCWKSHYSEYFGEWGIRQWSCLIESVSTSALAEFVITVVLPHLIEQSATSGEVGGWDAVAADVPAEATHEDGLQCLGLSAVRHLDSPIVPHLGPSPSALALEVVLAKAMM